MVGKIAKEGSSNAPGKNINPINGVNHDGKPPIKRPTQNKGLIELV